MAIVPFIAKTVQPGEPVTAQAWNDIVTALAALIQHVETSEATSLGVTVTNTGIDPLKIRVTAVRDDGLTAEAVAPVPPGTRHVFAGLTPGVYTVRAEAPGFTPASTSVTVPSPGLVALTMTPSGAVMPAVFGGTLQTALGTLANLGIAVSRVLDVTGRDVAPANPGAEYATSPVLLQLPEAGTPVAPGGAAQLVVAAALQVKPSIEVPPLTGLTLAEAQKALEGVGLVLGKVTTTMHKNEF